MDKTALLMTAFIRCHYILHTGPLNAGKKILTNVAAVWKGKVWFWGIGVDPNTPSALCLHSSQAVSCGVEANWGSLLPRRLINLGVFLFCFA